MSEIEEFYKGKSVMVTGASGFMGKVLVEKMLYSFPDMGNIYILMRPKRGKTVETRVDEMFKIPLFSRLREERPTAFSKVVPLQGDVTIDHLGLSEESKQCIIDHVNIVIHGAATLRLDAKLKDAINMNTEGTKHVIDICKQMKNLKALVHLSTAFCHVDHEVMEERVYNPPKEPEDIIRLTKWMDDKMLEEITPNLLSPHPNSYTYSKRLAEYLVAKHFPQLPVSIARPSIVCPAATEPIPGWVDNLNGPVGLLVAGAKGVIRTMHCKAEYHAEVIPVDMAINGIIAIAWKVGVAKGTPNEIPVYNLTQSGTNPVTWGEVLQKGRIIAHEYPFEMMLWYPDGDIRSNKLLHDFYTVVYHWLPAYIIDFLMVAFRQKTFMVRLQHRIQDGLDVLQYFTTREWVFRNDKLIALRESMNSIDRKRFTLDFERIEIMQYLKNGILGARLYVMKEDPNSLPRCRRVLKLMYVLDRATFGLLWILVAWLLVSCSETARFVLDTAKDSLAGAPFIRSLTLS